MFLTSANLWCPRCAKPLPSAARFCRRCGQALNTPPIRVPNRPQQVGWTRVAAFATASAWHAANGLLARHHITSRMAADTTSTRTDVQQMELLVLASEAERARTLLSHGIAELASHASPSSSGGAAVLTPVSTSARGRQTLVHSVAPLAMTPPGQAPGSSIAYARVFVLLWVTLIVTMIVAVAIFFA